MVDNKCNMYLIGENCVFCEEKTFLWCFCGDASVPTLSLNFSEKLEYITTKYNPTEYLYYSKNPEKKLMSFFFDVKIMDIISKGYFSVVKYKLFKDRYAISRIYYARHSPLYTTTVTLFNYYCSDGNIYVLYNDYFLSEGKLVRLPNNEIVRIKKEEESEYKEIGETEELSEEEAEELLEEIEENKKEEEKYREEEYDS